MKDCRSIQRDLSAYVDGELTGTRRTVLEAHLRDCPGCRAQAAELQQLAQGVAALPSLPVPPSFLGEVRQKIAAGHGRLWGRLLFQPVWWKVPLEAIALVAVLFAVGVFYRSTQPRELVVDRGFASARAETKAKANESGPAAPGRRATILSDEKDSRVTGAESLSKKLADKTADLPAPVLQLAPAPAPAQAARDDAGVATLREREVPPTSAPAEVTEQAHAVALPTAAAPQLESKASASASAGFPRGVAGTTAGELVYTKEEQSPGILAQIPMKTRDVESARHRVAGVAAHTQGRVVNWDAQRQVVQVELPAKNVELFTHALNPPVRYGADRLGRHVDDRLAAQSPAGATQLGVLSNRAAVATGTIAGAKQDGAVLGAGSFVSKASSNVVVEVLILPVKSEGQ